MIVQPDDQPPLAAYFEGGGTLGFSANIETPLSSHTTMRIGGLMFPVDDGGPSWSALVSVNRLFGGDGRYVEIGAGVAVGHCWWDCDRHPTQFTPSIDIGYRLQNRTGFFRIGLATAPSRLIDQRWHPARQ